jgi:hypothetical protein
MQRRRRVRNSMLGWRPKLVSNDYQQIEFTLQPL